MARCNKLDHFYSNIEDYLDDEPIVDDMSYLNMKSGDNFEDYLDYRATRKTSRKGRGKRGSRGDMSQQNLSDGWDKTQFG